MTDFIPFGTPPGSTGNPKQLPGDIQRRRRYQV